MEFPYHIVTKNARQTSLLGQKLAEELILSQKEGREEQAAIICLYGELGSGKTTFAQGFAKGLSIDQRLLSPTFIIVRRYEIPRTDRELYHVDLYRVGSEKDIEDVGLTEIFLDPSAVVLVEWADRLENYLPQKRVDIWFSVLEDEQHQVSVMNTLQQKL